jgi:phage FluMu protein Com
MTRWGEIKCPRCEELEAKLERAEDFAPQAGAVRGSEQR